jgi:YesN/AraC family two-component response regulator
VEQELSEAFDRLNSTVEKKAKENRDAIDEVHSRVTDQGTEHLKAMAAHEKDSAVRANDLKRDHGDNARETKRVEQKIDDHTKFHKDQKTSSRALWLAIGTTLIAALVGMLKDCAKDF